MRKYTVKVSGPLGTVFSGGNEFQACCAYDDAVKQSQVGEGAGSCEDVVLFLNDKPVRKFTYSHE